MNEQQRADFVARAVDDLISGIEPAHVPADLDARDVDAILQVARSRLETARSAAHDGIHYEGTVWQRVLERLGSAGTVMPQGALAGPPASRYDLSDEAALREMAVLRRQMSAQLHAFAENHREDVWRRVQARMALGEEPTTQGAFARVRSSLLARFNRSQPGQAYADLVAPALDSVAAGRPAEVGDSELDEVVKVAWNRKAASQVAATSAEIRRDRVWGKVHANITSGTAAPSSSAPRSWPRAVAIGAAAAIAIAAIGPLPATGFANHPAVQAVRLLGGHIGVVETGTPPDAGDGTVVSGSPATASQASDQLGFAVIDPETPPGFNFVSARVFPSGITSASGMFASSYSGAGGRTISVYQERASGAALAAASGSATDLVLANGTPATYFDGRWGVTDGGFQWILGGTQTIVFDHDGVRTIIVHSGPADAGFLAAFAASVAAR
jgi:hypothetical protein